MKKDIIITGGHSGIGLELTRLLLKNGHKVGLIVRSESRKKDALALFPNNESVEIFVADLGNREEIQQVSDEIASSWKKVDVLFNNAGLLLDDLYWSDHGNELQLEVNAISPYLLTNALKPLLEKAANPVVVSTATGGLHKKKSIDIPAFKKPQKFTKLLGSYIDSKLVLVLLMNYLDNKWEHIRFVNVNPGAIKTKMTAGSGMPFWLKPIRNLFFTSPERGGENLFNAAFSQKYLGSGILISDGKITTMQVEISEQEIEELLA
ncbi:MAG: SDR family NAD(P)-dependent oxidoreductase [Bacteroidota bacterium]